MGPLSLQPIKHISSRQWILEIILGTCDVYIDSTAILKFNISTAGEFKVLGGGSSAANSAISVCMHYNISL